MTTSIDLTNCDREPIHIPGSIQPHGVLLTLHEPELAILQMSANAPEALGMPDKVFAGQLLSELFLAEDLEVLATERLKDGLSTSPRYLMRLRSTNDKQWVAAVHSTDGVTVLELELREEKDGHLAAELHAALRGTAAELDRVETLVDFCQCAAAHLRDFTGFDRVMVYRFHEDGHGSVIAEAKEVGLDPFLGLHYPASDIPAQARELYVRNPFRLTADVNATPVRLAPGLNPETGRPLDMSYCALRATSPIHLEYLRNMGVAASLSFSILREGQLWGLFACHHGTPKLISQETRIAGEILARLLGLQVGLKEQAEQRSYALGLQTARRELIEQLTETGNFERTFVHGNTNLLSSFRAGGAALVTASKTFLLGETPDLDAVEQLCKWLDIRHAEPIWSSDSICSEYAEAGSLRHTSGVLAMRVATGSPEAVLWFRPEVVETVKWAGNPNKPVQLNEHGEMRLHPRRSFAVWQEQVKGKSEPWQEPEIDHARILRESMSQALLRHRASEIQRLNGELTRSNRELEQFAALASHDLQEPLRTVTAHTQLLARSVLPDASEHAQRDVEFILDATKRMRALIDSLLDYARMGRRPRPGTSISMNKVLQSALANLQTSIEESAAQIEADQLPALVADSEQMVRVLQNLISNAIKYRRPGSPVLVKLRVDKKAGAWQFTLQDNGIGFEPQYADRIFESFERLQSRGQSGTGLGLAICRRIIENHGGAIWAEGRPGQGATFYFTLPSRM